MRSIPRFSGLRFLLWALGSTAALLILAGAYFQFWIISESKWAQGDANPAVRAVLRTCFWSKLSGGYWENEMLGQSQTIARLHLRERVDFYREIVIHCDLDTSRAFLFVEMVGDDDRSLYRDLENFRRSERFYTLDTEQRERVEGWIIELRELTS